METLPYTYYQEDEFYIGWLEDYPDYRTQGATMDELQENLRDIYAEISGGHIPHVRRTGQLVVE